MFNPSFVNSGRIEVSGNSVRLYEGRYENRNLQVPGGNVRSAVWQGNNVHVTMEDGWHYIYSDFGVLENSWRD